MTTLPTVPANWHEDGWRSTTLRRELSRQSLLLSQLARSLRNRDEFPTETPKRLCTMFAATSDLVYDNLSKAPDSQLSLVGVLLEQLGCCLRYVERSRITETPWSMVQSAERFLKANVGEDADFVIRPCWSYNYSLTGEFVGVMRRIVQSLSWISMAAWESAALADMPAVPTPGRIYCISFPRVERLNAILHALFGHELGHILTQAWVESDFDAIWSVHESNVRQVIEANVKSSSFLPTTDTLFRDHLVKAHVAARVNEAMQLVRDGLQELLCDAVGAHLFGPAALAATMEFASRFSLDGDPRASERYPPWRYRLRKSAEACRSDISALEGMAFGQEDKAIIDAFIGWIRQADYISASSDDATVLALDEATSEAYKVIETEFDKARIQVLGRLRQPNPGVYSIATRAKGILDLVRKLNRGIPPNELGEWPNGKPADLADILNAAWVFKISQLTRLPDWGRGGEHDVLFRLVLKAIESSDVHKTYASRLI